MKQKPNFLDALNAGINGGSIKERFIYFFIYLFYMPAYKEKFINQITKEDSKIAVSGLIIDKDNDIIFIDDTTGVIAVNVQTDFPLNTFVRVFGFLVNNGEGTQLQGQIVQDLTQVNKQLYQRTKKLLNQKQ